MSISHVQEIGIFTTNIVLVDLADVQNMNTKLFLQCLAIIYVMLLKPNTIASMLL